MFYSFDKWIYKVKEVEGQQLERRVPEIIQHLKDQVPALLVVKERLRQEQEKRDQEWEEQKRRWAIAREQELIEKATKKSRDWVNEIILAFG
jgi:hypothetical protein